MQVISHLKNAQGTKKNPNESIATLVPSVIGVLRKLTKSKFKVGFCLDRRYANDSAHFKLSKSLRANDQRV
jgi:hypothetical protein